ncbi:hypothetical protein [Polaribacter porphyrae]|uniref:Serine protease n=1 Tax=Polaribacter porphyrae TaxID=1137780 RepID=A0A2S7WJN4_9FLAO|nr:hypothetical protein [Polaribacter porphyrae]PQJ77818.1 hypothetical protein BTO18_00850 [Polaribacter porphyrae]
MTELEANNLLDEVGETVFKEYKKYEGFIYLAVVNDKCFNYYLEIGRDKSLLNNNILHEIKTNIRNKSTTYINKIFLKQNRNKRYTKKVKKIKIAVKNLDKINDNRDNKILEQNDKTEYLIYNSSRNGNLGSLGGIYLNNYDNKYYLISNYHVIYGNKDKDIIYNTIPHPLGKLKWQLHDATENNFGEYDVAIAEIENNHYLPTKFTYRFNHKNLEEATLKNKYVKIFGGKRGWDNNCTLHSVKAIARAGNYIYKNQLLFLSEKIGHGDSGSLLINKNNNNVIGLYIGQNQYPIRVANNLHNLFFKSINSQNENILKLLTFN